MRPFLISLLLLVSLALAACSGRPSGPTEIVVKAEALKFSPATIEVTAGTPVKLTFENVDSVDHDLSVMEFSMAKMGATAEPMAGHDMGSMTEEPDLHIVAAMGAKSSLEFTPTQPGTYEFLCTVPGHKEAGMVGTLIVKSP